jgi:hypothetical protein
LAYKVEQEKCIANELQKTLSKEQETASDVRKRLVVEQNAVQDLKSELHACKQENTSLLESLDKVQQEVLRLRYGHVTWSYCGTSSASAGRCCGGFGFPCDNGGRDACLDVSFPHSSLPSPCVSHAELCWTGRRRS